ncbi:MAG: Ig-like domain-containing protein [Planctomycetes bacterium]|nr:Ig-like domain-containing protein [Planctomycetota bacterium]
MSKRLSQLGLCGCLILVVLLVGCENEVRARSGFHAEAVTAGQGPIWRNESILVRFSRPLSSEPLPDRALIVREAHGRLVKIELERDGRHLIVTPALSSAIGGVRLWPRTTELSLSIPVPLAGPTFRSLDGAELARGYSTRVKVNDGERRLQGGLELVSSIPDTGATDIDMDQEIHLQFNAPLDVRSLETGIQVIDRRRRNVVGATPRLAEHDHREVVIKPFEVELRDARGMSLFNAGAIYDVVITPSLRSRDGRRPTEQRSITFTTVDKGPRLLAVQFADETDFDPESRSVYHDARGMLRPRLRKDAACSPGDGHTELVSLRRTCDPDADPQTVPHVFSSCPARSQVLIPGNWLGGRPVFVTGIAFLATGPFTNPVTADDLIVSIGYLNRKPEEVHLGLGMDLDLNLIGGQSMNVGAVDDKVEIRPIQTQPGIVSLRFEEPFHYVGGNRDLVIDIRHQGIENVYATAKDGLDIRGAPHAIPGQGRPRLAIATGRASTAEHPPSDFSLRCILETAVNEPIVTRWYVVSDVDKPRFKPQPPALGTHLSKRDFKIEFQAGRPDLDANGEIIKNANGTPRCIGTGVWTTVPPQDGSRAVRLRITFTDRWYSPGEDLPEIEYILLRYLGG